MSFRGVGAAGLVVAGGVEGQFAEEFADGVKVIHWNCNSGAEQEWGWLVA